MICDSVLIGYYLKEIPSEPKYLVLFYFRFHWKSGRKDTDSNNRKNADYNPDNQSDW